MEMKQPISHAPQTEYGAKCKLGILLKLSVTGFSCQACKAARFEQKSEFTPMGVWGPNQNRASNCVFTISCRGFTAGAKR
jgi:hypothetical protein